MRRASTKKAQESPTQQPGFKKVRRTEEFIEAVKDETQPTVITVPATEIEDEEPLDRFEQFFAQVRDQQGWTLLVYRLNNFFKDGKTDLRGDKTYVGRITFDPDTYLDDIQAMCLDGGAFKLQAKTPDGHFSEQWVEQIMPLKSNKAAAAANTHFFIQPPANGQPAPEPRDTLKEFLQSLKTVKEIKEVIGGNENHNPPIAPVTTIEREPLQERIISAALDAVLKEKPADAADILKAYLAPAKDDFSWGEIIKELIKPLAPIAMGLLQAYAANQARAAQQPPPQNGQPQQAALPAMTTPPMQPQAPQPTVTIQNMATGDVTGYPAGMEPPPGWMVVQPFTAMADMPPASVTQPTQPDNPEDETDMAQDELLDTLANMLDDCVRRGMSDPAVIESGRQMIVDFKTKFPKLDAFIGMLVTMPPQGVLGFLAMQFSELAPLVNNPVAIQVITDLQAAIKPEPVQ